jgi:site-specific recombinase XerC
LKYLEEVYQLSPDSIRRYWFYLRHLLIWADEMPLGQVPNLRPTFPVYISSIQGQEGGALGPSYQKKIVETARRLFAWLKATYPNEFSCLPSTRIETLRTSRLPQPSEEHVFVTLDEVLQLVSIPIEEENIALQRDQAAAAMLFLSGMRSTAFTTLPIEAVSLANRSIKQWPELGVKTKNGKRATTYLLPIPKLLNVIESWDLYIRSKLPSTARWYTPIESQRGRQTLSRAAPGKNRHQAL